MRAGMALAIHAKQKGGQAIENKQLSEMAYFAPLMISRTYGRLAKPFVSLGERILRFCRFFGLVDDQNARERNQRRIRGSRGGR
jgi:hypothetical protein